MTFKSSLLTSCFSGRLPYLLFPCKSGLVRERPGKMVSWSPTPLPKCANHFSGDQARPARRQGNHWEIERETLGADHISTGKTKKWSPSARLTLVSSRACPWPKMSAPSSTSSVLPWLRKVSKPFSTRRSELSCVQLLSQKRPESACYSEVILQDDTKKAYNNKLLH